MVGRSDMNWKQKIIDPKDKTNAINSSWLNLGNHILIAGFIGFIVFVIMASY